MRNLAGKKRPDGGRVVHGHGLRLDCLAQEHDTLDPDLTVIAHLASAAPHLGHGEVRRVLGSFLFTGDDATSPSAPCPAVRRPASRSEEDLWSEDYLDLIAGVKCLSCRGTTPAAAATPR